MKKDYRIDPGTQDYSVTGGQYALSDDLGNNIYLSLMVRKGSWPFAPSLGSNLHLLGREKALVRVESRAVEYCNEALKWILDEGRASRIEVTATLDREKMRLRLLIEVTQKGKTATYEHFIEVR